MRYAPPGHVLSQWKNTPATDRGVMRSKHSTLHGQGRGCCPSAPVAWGVHECYEKVVGAMCKTNAKLMGKGKTNSGKRSCFPNGLIFSRNKKSQKSKNIQNKMLTVQNLACVWPFFANYAFYNMMVLCSGAPPIAVQRCGPDLPIRRV